MRGMRTNSNKSNPMRNTTQLGSLDLVQYFRLPKRKTIYRTIDYPDTRHWTRHTKRWCLNMRTLVAEHLGCRERVEKVPRGKSIESSEKIENK
jgi:hypothetical protein